MAEPREPVKGSDTPALQNILVNIAVAVIAGMVVNVFMEARKK